jgi:hypothetical protein
MWILFLLHPNQIYGGHYITEQVRREKEYKEGNKEANNKIGDAEEYENINENKYIKRGYGEYNEGKVGREKGNKMNNSLRSNEKRTILWLKGEKEKMEKPKREQRNARLKKRRSKINWINLVYLKTSVFSG